LEGTSVDVLENEAVLEVETRFEIVK